MFFVENRKKPYTKSRHWTKKINNEWSRLSLLQQPSISSIYIENVRYSVTVKLIIVSVTNRTTHDMATYLVDDGNDAKK